MDRRFAQMDNRLVRIENIPMGRPPNADGVSAATSFPEAPPADPARRPATKRPEPPVS